MDPKDDPKDDKTSDEQLSDSDDGDDYSIFNESEQPLTLTQPGLRYPGYGKPGHVPPQPRVPLPYPEDVDSIEKQAREIGEAEGTGSDRRKKRRRHPPKTKDVGEAVAAAAAPEDGEGTGTVSGSQPTGGACPRGLDRDVKVPLESTSSETSSPSSSEESEESAVDLSKDFSDSEVHN